MTFGIYFLLALAIACFFYACTVFKPKVAASLLFLKLLLGFVAIAYYTQWNNEGDLTYYHETSSRFLGSIQEGYPVMDFLAQEADPAANTTPQNRTFFFVKLLTLVYMLLGPDIWLANALFSLMAFASGIYFIRRMKNLFPSVTIPAVVTFFLWPQVGIWGGGVSKETLLIISFLIFFGAITPLFVGNRDKWWLHSAGAALALLLLAKVRFFVLLALLPCVLTFTLIYFLQKRETTKNVKWIAGAVGLLLIAGATLLFSYFDTSFRPPYFLTALMDNHAAIVANSKPEHIVQGLSQLSSGAALVGQFGVAAVAGIFGPFLWEISSMGELLIALESLLLVTLVLLKGKMWKSTLPTLLLIATLSYVFFTSGMITLSAPNYGSLSRYRLAFYPFLVLLTMYGHPLLARFPRLKSLFED